MIKETASRGEPLLTYLALRGDAACAVAAARHGGRYIVELKVRVRRGARAACLERSSEDFSFIWRRKDVLHRGKIFTEYSDAVTNTTAPSPQKTQAVFSTRRYYL